MSLPLLVTINALAAIVLLAGLAYAMSRPTLLKPHAAPMSSCGGSPAVAAYES